MSRKIIVNWTEKGTPRELRKALEACADSHPIVKDGSGGLAVRFEKAAGPGLCEVLLGGTSAVIRYDRVAQAMRGVGALLSGLVKPGAAYREQSGFSMLGVMLDCSRNAVMTVDHLKLWFRRLALLGYDTVMLYTEETYELPGEPFFGYGRGAYTKAELKAIDREAALLGIEIIPCIQTLGHLEKILWHPAYKPIMDINGVLLVGEEKTYELIEKMIAHWASVCKTRRFHIGMDETHGLGRGRYQDLHGVRSPFDIFNEHLKRVVDICAKHGVKPMIWSDMYFRFGNEKHEYYAPDAEIPDNVVKAIPREVELVYWDYYHSDKDMYRRMIARHRSMGYEPLMGSGIWTWNRLWYDHKKTTEWAGPCIDVCIEEGLREIFFTMWGDNGAYCDHDSAFAGIAWCADRIYSAGQEPDAARLEKRFGAVCGGSYAAHIEASDISTAVPGLEPSRTLWNDPFAERGFRNVLNDDVSKMAEAAKTYDKLATCLQKHAKDRTTGDMRFAALCARAIAERYGVSARAVAAYRKGDRKALAKVFEQVPGAAKACSAAADAFREMWLAHNKPEGLEFMQQRFGMIGARYKEMQKSLAGYLAGGSDSIPELGAPCPADNKIKSRKVAEK